MRQILLFFLRSVFCEFVFFDLQNVEVMSDEDDDEEDDIIAMVPISESSKLVSLEKMVWLLAVLVENSRGDDNRVRNFLQTKNRLRSIKNFLILITKLTSFKIRLTVFVYS